MKLFVALVLLSFILLVVYAYNASNSNGGPILPLNVSNNTTIVVNTSDQPIVTNGTNKTYPLQGQWICGNGIADPKEDCFSCPKDLPEECGCLSPEPVTFEKEVGESFCFCSKQTVKIDDMEIELSNPSIHRVTIHMPDGDSTIVSPKEDPIELWSWKDSFLRFYELVLEKKIYHGICLRLNYPRAPEGEEFQADNGATFQLGGTETFFTAKIIDHSNSTMELEIISGDSSTTELLSPGENVSVGDYVIKYNSFLEEVFLVTVEGGEDL